MSLGCIGESLLLQGYGIGLVDARPCACGGFIGAISGGEADAVYAHNGSELHQMWRVWADALDEMRGQDVEVIPVADPLFPVGPTAIDVSGASGRPGTVTI